MTSTDETAYRPEHEAALSARVGAHLIAPTSGAGLRVGVVCGRFNGGITHRLLVSALDAFEEAGVGRHDVTVAWVPGAFEIPLASRAMATSGRFDAVLTLGAVIRGDTGHYEVVAGECARGVQDVQLSTGVPVIFGVLTTNTVEQALERSLDDETNKGRETALTALEMANLLKSAPLRP